MRDVLVNQRGNKQAALSLILTVVLVIVALLVFPIARSFPNSDLRIFIGIYILIDIGFIVAMILGIKTKQIGIRVLSIVSNGFFFVAVTFVALVLALANGLSEP